MMNQKPKRDENGYYYYRGLTICNLGYDRVNGCVVWSVTNADGIRVAQGMSLKDAVHAADRFLKGDGMPASSFY